MLDNYYLEAMAIINETRYKLQSILNKNIYKGLENQEAYNKIDALVEELEDINRNLNYLGAPTREGILVKGSNGKFYISFDDGDNYQLSCGCSLEIYLKDDISDEKKWFIGRVEYNNGYYFNCYYFHPESRPILHENMRVRIRENE